MRTGLVLRTAGRRVASWPYSKTAFHTSWLDAARDRQHGRPRLVRLTAITHRDRWSMSVIMAGAASHAHIRLDTRLVDRVDVVLSEAATPDRLLAQQRASRGHR
jgi:hypothetical protein